MKEYKTSNLYEASFLACRGFNFSGKEKKGKKTVLIFSNSKKLSKAVVEFYAGGTVKAKELFDWYRTLKDYVFSDR